MTAPEDTAALISRAQSWLSAQPKGDGRTMHASHPEVIVGELLAAVEAIGRERDFAQSMVQAWDSVFGTIEAHIMDRENMRDPGNPGLYLSIIRSDIANIKRSSDQICAARWADRSRAEACISTANAEVERLREALRQIADLDSVESALDPEWTINRARSALSQEPSRET